MSIPSIYLPIRYLPWWGRLQPANPSEARMSYTTLRFRDSGISPDPLVAIDKRVILAQVKLIQ